jgi:ribosomal protein S18 acetylase RimI-like enzyme
MIFGPKQKFRLATVEDADALVSLANTSYRGESGKRGWTTESDLLDGTRTDKTEVEMLVTTPGSAIILCVERNSIVGSVHVERQGFECYLGMLMVNPEAQGAGVGSRLIEAAEKHARSVWESKTMTMSVISIRTELIKYYERRGYHRTGKLRPFVADEVHGMPRIPGLQFETLEKDLTQ